MSSEYSIQKKVIISEQMALSVVNGWWCWNCRVACVKNNIDGIICPSCKRTLKKEDYWNEKEKEKVNFHVTGKLWIKAKNYQDIKKKLKNIKTVFYKSESISVKEFLKIVKNTWNKEYEKEN